MQPILLMLESGRTAPAVRVQPHGMLVGLAQALNLSPCRGAIAVVGGAGAFDGKEYALVRAKVDILLKEVAHLALVYNLAVVDGGTRFGVMRLLGETCRDYNYRFPLVGVAPTGVVIWNSPGAINYQQTWFGRRVNPEELMRRRLLPAEEPVPLDDNHSAFVLVEANQWGDEVEMLALVAHELANGHVAIEVLVNGGAVARRDVTAYLRRGGQVIVVAGTGRLADELAMAVRLGYSSDPEIQMVLDSNRVHVFSADDSPQLFASMLMSLGRWSN